MRRSRAVLRVDLGRWEDDSCCRCSCSSETRRVARDETVPLPRLLRRDSVWTDKLFQGIITFLLGLLVLMLLLRIMTLRRRKEQEQIVSFSGLLSALGIRHKELGPENVVVQREQEIEVLRKWMESKGEEFFRPVWDKLTENP
jgi:hypothetical protein